MSTLVDEWSVRSRLDEPSVWPNLSQAAGIVGLSKGTLSKQVHAGRIAHEVLGFGQGRHVFSPREVLRIGCLYRRVPPATVVERLAAFLGSRLEADSSMIERVLWQLMQSLVSDRQPSERTGRVEGTSSGASASGPRDAEESMPSWLAEVEQLRANPSLLAGTVSFPPGDDLIGAIQLGPSVDEPGDAELAERQVRW